VELGPRPTVERAPPVTEEEWARHLGPEGRLQQIPELKNRIFSGVSTSRWRVRTRLWVAWRHHPEMPVHLHSQGLSPGLRREAWKFLLGYLAWEGSAEEHKAHVRKKT
jgi:hypothetical protein